MGVKRPVLVCQTLRTGNEPKRPPTGQRQSRGLELYEAQSARRPAGRSEGPPRRAGSPPLSATPARPGRSDLAGVKGGSGEGGADPGHGCSLASSLTLFPMHNSVELHTGKVGTHVHRGLSVSVAIRKGRNPGGSRHE